MPFSLSNEHRASMEEFRRRQRSGILVLLFTDMVGSTKLKQDLGDQRAVAIIRQHHVLIRDLLKAFPDGKEIDAPGDSFFIAFVKPSDGVKFALLVQAAMRRLTAEAGHTVAVRIGIHAGEVFIEENQQSHKPMDLYGIQVDTSARVMSLAQGNQILLTRFVFDNARQLLKGGEIPGVGALSWLNHGPYLVKGVEEPAEICEVGEVGAAFLGRPPDSEKAHRHISADAEPVLGWRPAVGQAVPNTGWVLEQELGAGGFGEVWLGQNEKLRERRVFKFCFRADRVRSLKREVTLFRLLKERGKHPNIVGIQDVFFDEPPFYIMMDYADGEDLGKWSLKQGGLEKVPMEARLEIISQVADALQAAHEAGIIHRDVKPSNIIVSGSHPGTLRVKLTDFGIGQVMSKDVLSGVTQMGFTQTMTGSSDTGTPMYMAPELLAGQPASAWSDVYSLGVVLYQLLTADLRKPVTMDWGRQVTEPLLREDLAKCLAGNPLERFSGTQELALRLRSLEERRKTLAIQAAESAARERAAHRKKLLRAALFVSALSVITGMALLTTDLGTGLASASYDLPFRLLDTTNNYNSLPHEAVAVYLDDSSHEHLHQDYLKPWNRGYYAKLVNRCTVEGAKAVVFDIVFSDAMDTNTDQQFADAMRENGKVIIACDWTIKNYGVKGRIFGKVFTKVLDKFNATADVGADTVFPDAGENIRKYKPMITDSDGRQLATEAWAAALLVRPSLHENTNLQQGFFWLNYYAPEMVMPSLSFYKAISEHDPDVPPGFFRNRVVFVGEKLETYRPGERRDEFSSPFSYRNDNKWYSGVGIHETAYLNIIRGDYLRRVPWERISTFVLGILFGTIFVACRPLTAVFVAVFLAVVIGEIDYLLFTRFHYWFAWLVVWTEIAVALACSIVWEVAQTYGEGRRSRKNLQTRTAE